jgi:hypothetical protein
VVATARVAKANANPTTTTETVGNNSSKTTEATTSTTLLLPIRRTAQTSVNPNSDATMTKALTTTVELLSNSSRSKTVAMLVPTTTKTRAIKVRGLKAKTRTGRATNLQVLSLSKIATLSPRTECRTSMASKVRLQLPMLSLAKATTSSRRKSSVDLLRPLSNRSRNSKLQR